MKLNHIMIDGTEMVSYLRYRQSQLKIGSAARKELESAIIYIVGQMKENKDGES